jgi:hypothetical protein
LGTPGAFSAVLHQTTDFYAAWYPVANVWKVGDIGVVSDGVLVRTGNLTDFGLEVTARATPSVKGINVTSEGTKTAKLIGDAEVPALPDSDIEARLVVEFTRQDSFMLKAASLTVTEMDSVDEVASRLAKLRDRRWRRRSRVVYATAEGTDMALVSARDAGATFEIRGTAAALKQLDIGRATAGLELSSSSHLGLDFVGDSGTIGLRMFKLGPWTGGVKLLGSDDDATIGVETDFGDTLADDV